VAQNPDPKLVLTDLAGTARTIDDWATIFSLAIVLLPARLEAAAFVPVIDRIYNTFGDSDVRTTVCVAANPAITRRILGDAAQRYLTFCDPDHTLATSLGLQRLPAFVHLRQDTTLVASSQGWSASEWQKVADRIARHVHWSSPIVAGPRNPAPSPGWELTA
jgi:hypothetical protein